MGHKTKKNDHNHTEYRSAVNQMEKIFNHHIARPWMSIILIAMFTSYYRKEKKLSKILHNYTETIIKEKMNKTDNLHDEKSSAENDDIYIGKKKRRLAMLDILLEAHKDGQINYEGICEEVDTFTFEVEMYLKT